MVPPLAAAAIEIDPEDTLAPAGTVSAVVEGMLVVQVRPESPESPPLPHGHSFVAARSLCVHQAVSGSWLCLLTRLHCWQIRKLAPKLAGVCKERKGPQKVIVCLEAVVASARKEGL